MPALEKQLLQQPYTRDNYKTIIQHLFPTQNDWFVETSEDYNDDIGGVAHIYQLASVSLDDEGTEIPIFEIQLNGIKKIVRNRVGLRNIVRRLMKQTADDFAAIAAFFDLETEQWRFTFINRQSEFTADGDYSTTETESKRYTYVFGTGETVLTAYDNFKKINANPQPQRQDIIDAFSVEKVSKDFFTEYVKHYNAFCDYLYQHSDYPTTIFGFQEGESEEERKKKEKHIRDFVKKMLGRIVFLYFLQKKGWMGVPLTENEYKNGELQFLQKLFENHSNQNEFYSEILVPLFFDTLNRKRPSDHYTTTWSDVVKVPFLNGGLFENKNEATNTINFPANYFQSLFEFFAKYNFTIDENRLEEHEVGIDPEMLGHIFENLLEDNKDKGAYYTPKEIVHYMCQESLIQYLKTHLSDAPDDAIERLVRLKDRGEDTTDNYIRTAAGRISDLLDQVKICDPAIGSGAFPMGLLHEIFECKSTLDWTLMDNAATIKRNIIQQSIYGVDIDKGAVDIAQLRFWLSLVVEEEVPSPLPNLDYKIMQGNSLLESFEGIDLSKAAQIDKNVQIVEPARDLFGNIIDNQMKITFTQTQTVEEINRLIDEYFHLNDKERKGEIKRKIEKEIKENIIEYNLELREKQLIRQISEAQQAHKLSRNAKKDLQQWKDELAGFSSIRQKLDKITHSEERPYFLWHLYFKDVFDKGGFDIVIGNPPYGANIPKSERNYYKDSFQIKSIETAILFIQQGHLIAKDGGNLSYIIPKSFTFSSKYKAIRDFVKNDLELIVDCGKAFSEVRLEATIFQIIKKKTRKEYRSYLFTEQNKFSFLGSIQKIEIDRFDFILNGVNDNEITLAKKILSNSTLLGEISTNVRGGYLQKKIKASGEYGVVGGGQINRYGIRNFKGYVNKEDFQNLDKAQIGANSVLAQNIVAHITKPYEHIKIIACLPNSDKDFVILDTINQITVQSSLSASYIYVLLNSKLICWYCYLFIYAKAIRTMHFDNVVTNRIPIQIISKPIEQLIQEKVTQILTFKQSAQDTTHLERQIDLMVYKLYDLTHSEAQLVDDSLRITAATYDALTVSSIGAMAAEEVARFF